MRIVMISNYLNHHQIPFCNEICRQTADAEQERAEFFFIQTEPMDAERAGMGWQSEYDLPYLCKYYEEEVRCHSLLMNAEIVIFGGTERRELLRERMSQRRRDQVTFVYSERLYREGQWKFISPRGLIDKYQLYTKYRRENAFLMCAGAFVASDFSLVHAFPGKKLKWGYFPGFRPLDVDQLIREKEMRIAETGRMEVLWAGRFMPLKHPEYAIRLVRDLKEAGLGGMQIRLHLTMVGGGEMEEELHRLADEYGVREDVTFTGFLPPAQVREQMLASDVYLFTSNHLEGWGAVVNEAMNSGCVVIASHMAGATGYLIRHEENGLVFRSEHYEDLRHVAEQGLGTERQRREMRKNAYQTIADTWNERVAAHRFLAFATAVLQGKEPECEGSGPLSRAVAISPRKMYNHLVCKKRPC